jgi:uncharacterized membrane protein (UPF0127 family)
MNPPTLPEPPRAGDRALATRRQLAPALAPPPAALFAALLALLLALGAQPAAAQNDAATLPIVELSAGIHLIHAELAANDADRMKGLMFRTALAPNHGMLFVFDSDERPCMWMRNTLIPLSVAFLDTSGAIINVEEMAPRTEDTHCAAKPARYALEMSDHWFAHHGVRAGTVIDGVVRKK